MEQDLTTELKNYAISCRGRADKATQTAARRQADGEIQQKRSNIEGIARQWFAEAEALRAEAAVWRERARVADTGYLLIDPADFSFQCEYRDVMTRAIKAHRAKYTESRARGPLPVEAGARGGPPTA